MSIDTYEFPVESFRNIASILGDTLRFLRGKTVFRLTVKTTANTAVEFTLGFYRSYCFSEFNIMFIFEILALNLLTIIFQNVIIKADCR